MEYLIYGFMGVLVLVVGAVGFLFGARSRRY